MNAWVRIVTIIACLAQKTPSTLVDDINEYNFQHENLYNECDPNSPIIRCDLLPGMCSLSLLRIK